MEIELKLLIAPTDVAAFRRLVLLEQCTIVPPRAKTLHNAYFDTPERHLHQNGLQLRVRRVGRLCMQTLKSDEPAIAGLHQRHEWESRVAGPRPDLDALLHQVGVGSAWAKVLGAPGLAQALVPIFESRVKRTLWPLRLAQAEVELALDQGVLICGEAREPISELELELKAGSANALFELALQLQAALPLRMGKLSKSARGHALLAPVDSPAAVKPKPVMLDPGISLEQGARIIIGNCLAQMQDNEPGVLHGIEPESIHQMRIGMRRLRSALRLFGRWMPFPPALRDELGWLDAELAAARDADVFAHSTLASVVKACPQETGLLQLQASAALESRSRRQRAAAAVGSVRHSRLMLGLVGWVQSSGWQSLLDDAACHAPDQALEPQAGKILDRRLRKLQQSGRHLRRASPEERHRVRIAAKKARYAMEFFVSLHPVAHFKRSLQRLADLQGTLGGLNDAAVADRLLGEIARLHPELAGSAAFARGWLCAATQQELGGLVKRWKRFEQSQPGQRGRRR